MKITDRLKAPTPKYWRIVRNIAAACATVGTIIATAPVALPVGIITAGGYIAFGGTLLATFAQTAKKDK